MISPRVPPSCSALVRGAVDAEARSVKSVKSVQLQFTLFDHDVREVPACRACHRPRNRPPERDRCRVFDNRLREIRAIVVQLIAPRMRTAPDRRASTPPEAPGCRLTFSL